MKAVITHGAGRNHCRLNFFYEDYNGNRRYGFYSHAKKRIKSAVYLTAAIYNTYYCTWERVYTIILTQRPSISDVKEFMQETLQILKWS